MIFEDMKNALPKSEEELLRKFDEIAQERYDLSFRIDKLSRQLGDSFSNILKQRRAKYEPLDEDILEQSSKNDELINRYYELSNIMIAIENRLKDINKEK